MSILRSKVFLPIAVIALIGGGAWAWQNSNSVSSAAIEEAEPAAAQTDQREKLGLMTSLPLYWPLGAGMSDLASGRAEVPWQRKVLEAHYDLVLLDTLSPIAGLFPEDPETDPLAELDRLAVIQPRGLSPSDNVALDDWVRAGGELLLVLDPMLTGHYELPFGHPMRPVDTALIPPVVKRWGLQISYAPSHDGAAHVHETPQPGDAPVIEAGTLAIIDADAARCSLNESKVAATCQVGEGRVNLIADAAIFEHADLHEGGARNIASILSMAFD